MQKQWHLMQPDEHIVRNLSRDLGCSPLIAALLVNRQLQTAEAADHFLNPSFSHIRSPFALKDMKVAVNRLLKAVTEREKILIFGDYDADGVTATALLYEFFKQAGSPVSYYIPHRIREGYSLQPGHIRELALPRNFRLIVTADCGSASTAAIEAARRHGIDVIVTDHHQISDPPPAALAVINPHRRDCNAGFDHLAGVGVAFCLLICLRKNLRDHHFWAGRREPNLKRLCDLVALGTVADIVPLRDENRVFTHAGLDVIRSGGRSGLAALIRQSRLNLNHTDAADIAFRLAPRINAAGRMDHAAGAVDLLTADDPGSAARLAQQLDTLNSDRQQAEQLIIEDILTNIEKNPGLLEPHGLVLAGTDWHQGLLGIAASKIVERFYKPVALISIGNGIAKGSARSIAGFDLFRGLTTCSRHLNAFGGHEMAAGFSLPPENIDAFRHAFDQAARSMTTPQDYIPKLAIDLPLGLADITPSLLDEIAGLNPFGTGNPEPLFMATDVRIAASRIVGQNHRKMMLYQKGDAPETTVEAIQFNVPPDALDAGAFARIVFHLRWNHWNGRRTPQLVVTDVRT